MVGYIHLCKKSTLQLFFFKYKKLTIIAEYGIGEKILRGEKFFFQISKQSVYWEKIIYIRVGNFSAILDTNKDVQAQDAFLIFNVIPEKRQAYQKQSGKM